MAIYFTADTHFGHANIIKHCKRPFESVEAMDRTLLENLNRRVGVDDTLYHLGDFSFRGGDPAAYREKIACRNVTLILGNHDPRTKDGKPKAKFAALFADVRNLLEIEAEHQGASQGVVLCHYAMRVWNASHWGAWHLYGHSHGSLPDDPNARSYDVGVDPNAFAPLSVDEVGAIMARKRFVPIDHHQDRSGE